MPSVERNWTLFEKEICVVSAISLFHHSSIIGCLRQDEDVRSGFCVSVSTKLVIQVNPCFIRRFVTVYSLHVYYVIIYIKGDQMRIAVPGWSGSLVIKRVVTKALSCSRRPAVRLLHRPHLGSGRGTTQFSAKWLLDVTKERLSTGDELIRHVAGAEGSSHLSLFKTLSISTTRHSSTSKSSTVFTPKGTSSISTPKKLCCLDLFQPSFFVKCDSDSQLDVRTFLVVSVEFDKWHERHEVDVVAHVVSDRLLDHFCNGLGERLKIPVGHWYVSANTEDSRVSLFAMLWPDAQMSLDAARDMDLTFSKIEFQGIGNFRKQNDWSSFITGTNVIRLFVKRSADYGTSHVSVLTNFFAHWPWRRPLADGSDKAGRCTDHGIDWESNHWGRVMLLTESEKNNSVHCFIMCSE